MPPKKQGEQNYYGFDSSGLEKAAVAAKYLDASDNAKAAFEIALAKEKSTQADSEKQKVELEIRRSQVTEEEKRKTKQYEVEMGKRQAEYNIQLELQRDQQKLQQKEAMREQRRSADEESTSRQEQLKRQTLEYEYQLKASVKAQKLAQEMAAQKELTDKNHSFIENVFKKAETDRRETNGEYLFTAFNLVGSGIVSTMSNPAFMFKLFYYGIGIYGAFRITKTSINVAFNTFMGKFGRPTLVRETSKLSTGNFFKLPYLYTKKFVQMRMAMTEKNLLDGVILEKKLEAQIREISYAVLNRKKHYAPCKNMMFYGPPGTGKTLFAKKLAMKSGLEYAVMVGSDIAPLGPDAVDELNQLFDWAETQPNGIILFIDEADAFLRSRTGGNISEDARHAVNSFLYRTGSPSDKVVVVLATNCPEELDAAVHDRIDEAVGFGLPSEKEREIMLQHYLVKYCTPPSTQQERLKFAWNHPKSLFREKKLIRMEGISRELIADIAGQTQGFSGREIMKMVVAWHDAAFTLPDAVLTPEVMQSVLEKFHLQHKLKDTWTSSEALIYGKQLEVSEDHTGSQKIKVAGGKSEEMLKKQQELVDQIDQSRTDFSQMRTDKETTASEAKADENSKTL